jgi:hypothetical protein
MRSRCPLIAAANPRCPLAESGPHASGMLDSCRPHHYARRELRNMKFSDIEKSALGLNELYEQLEFKRYGRIWTTEELALGFVGDVAI